MTTLEVTATDRLLTMMMETIKTVGGQSSSLGVAKGCKFCGNHESAHDRGQRCDD
jgi:hypothetical protein